MKKMILLLALFLMLAGCTGSCGPGDETVSPTPSASGQASSPPSAAPLPETTPSAPPVPAPTPVAETPDQPAPTPSAEPETTPTPEPSVQAGPTDEEVLEAYRLAQEAFSWFRTAPMPFDPADSRTVNGVPYYRVDHEGIGSLSALRGYLKGLFSDALVDSLLPYDGAQYIDIDDALYVQDGGRGTDQYRGTEYTQVMRGDNADRVVVRSTVEVVDPEQNGAVTGTVTYDFPYEKVGEQWIFTDFSLVR